MNVLWEAHHTYPARFGRVVPYATEHDNGPSGEAIDKEEGEVRGASAATPLEPPGPASHT